jgi:hypothetical protein
MEECYDQVRFTRNSLRPFGVPEKNRGWMKKGLAVCGGLQENRENGPAGRGQEPKWEMSDKQNKSKGIDNGNEQRSGSGRYARTLSEM